MDIPIFNSVTYDSLCKFYELIHTKSVRSEGENYRNYTYNIKKKATPIRLLLTVCLLVLFALPLSAQEEEDSVFIFRFFSGKNEFYAPGLGNGEEIAKMFNAVDRFKDLIDKREVSLYVNGYYISEGKKAETRTTAKLRSNRVKSELIVRKGLKEDNFITRNQPGDANYVTVSFSVPLSYLRSEPKVETPVEPVVEVVPDTIEELAETVNPEVTTVKEETAVVEAVETVVDTAEHTISPDSIAPVAKKSSFDRWSWLLKGDHVVLKTNLLDYAILMPNLELEWMFKKNWSAALEWQVAWYAKTTPHKVYRIGTVIPEVRYWLLERSRWHGLYVGAFVGGGEFDLSNGKKGHEGEVYFGGFSAGYMWPIGKYLSLDASVGLGYMRIHDKEYLPFDGHFLYQRTRNINYFGPLRAKLSLVWRFQSEK